MSGEFERDTNYIEDRITADGSSDWPVEPGRYRLVVARACPWANRAIIVRRLLGLEPVLSMGVYLGASTKIVDRATGEVFVGRVPAYSVVVPGALPGKPLPDGTPGPSLYCAVIVKRVDAQTRAKTGINELLRD